MLSVITRLNWVQKITIASLCVAGLLLIWMVMPKGLRADNERVVTVYYDGIEQTVVTDAKTVKEVLERAKVTLNEYDTVEPAANTELTSPAYNVNVYRARPVTVVDGPQRHTVMTSHTSAREIVSAAGLELYAEDITELSRINDIVREGGVGLKLTIDRATPVSLVLYGKKAGIRTQAATVEDLLKEKNVTLAEADGTNLPPQTPITPGLSIEVWRNGVQTITEEQEVAFTTKQILDTSKPIGFKEVQKPGVKGQKLVTYQVDLRNGQELSRKEIQSVVTKQPEEQVEVIGAKPGNGLSKSKGVNYFVDSKGVRHRETYYDLPMNGVMGYCGGGAYSVRADGAKVDKDGYILVAANLSRYPRCSVVETSLGLGKVYDTGGFASVHPDGFDLATDWSNYDGR